MGVRSEQLSEMTMGVMDVVGECCGLGTDRPELKRRWVVGGQPSRSHSAAGSSRASRATLSGSVTYTAGARRLSVRLAT